MVCSELVCTWNCSSSKTPSMPGISSVAASQVPLTGALACSTWSLMTNP
jgi:hypothetical protein